MFRVLQYDVFTRFQIDVTEICVLATQTDPAEACPDIFQPVVS